MEYFGIILVLTVVSVTLAHEECPPADEISPCTCDGEGVSCMNTATEAQIRKLFRAKYPFGGVPSIFIQGTGLTKVDCDLLGTVKAQSIYIEMNKVTEVCLDVFNHTKQYVKAFSCFGNELKQIPSGSLQDTLPELLILNYGKNHITSIPSNAFQHPTLLRLILAENRIETIGANAFVGLPNLYSLELFMNNLKTLAPYSIALASSFPGVEINLAINNITSIDPKAFDGASPQVLYLSSNKLETLKDDVFTPLLHRMFEHGGVIDVSENPLTCKGCDYEWIVSNNHVLSEMIIGFMCPDGTGISTLTKSKIGC